MHIDFHCIFCIFYILKCILVAYYFAYYVAYLAYYQICIFCIFCAYIAYCLHIVLHIILHILHIEWQAYCSYSAYYFAYFMHIILHILMHILHISVDAYCAYCTYCTLHIVHIVHILDEKSLSQGFIVYCHCCLVPHLRAQLFTYHHLQPSPLFADLSQKAPGKSAVSRRMAKGIVPVAPTGTRGRRPSMEDTGITYKTCACSWRS